MIQTDRQTTHNNNTVLVKTEQWVPSINMIHCRPLVTSIWKEETVAAAVMMAAMLQGSRIWSQTTVTGSRCWQLEVHVSDVTATYTNETTLSYTVSYMYTHLLRRQCVPIHTPRDALTVLHMLLKCHHYNIIRQRWFFISILKDLFTTIDAHTFLILLKILVSTFYNPILIQFSWIFQMCKFWQLACSMHLIFPPDGTNVYGSRTMEFRGSGSVQGIESCVLLDPIPFPIHLFRHCCGMYHLGTTHSITDRLHYHI